MLVPGWLFLRDQEGRDHFGAGHVGAERVQQKLQLIAVLLSDCSSDASISRDY